MMVLTRSRMMRGSRDFGSSLISSRGLHESRSVKIKGKISSSEVGN